MAKKEKKSRQFRQFYWNLALMATGSILAAIGINGILVPQRFVNGGVTAISIILYDQFPVFSVAVYYALLNIPLFVLAWLNVGRRFFYYSVMGMILFTCAIAFINIPPIPVQDKILSALLAGILTGAGGGIILRSFGSAGGTDILSIILLKRYSVSLGNTILIINCFVLSLVVFVFSLEATLYTLIVIFVTSKMVNLVVTGLSQRKMAIIISPQWELISDKILIELRRGVTVLHGEGGYTRKAERILYVVITFRELGFLKKIIKEIDPDAFVVVSDTLEVMNYRIGNQPHW
ncbi:MAG: YitT family protein [Desulfobacterales bacterium]|nr:YitT family protein [Desulfobacterales bacterium]